MADGDNLEILQDRDAAIKEGYTPFGRKLGSMMEEQYGLFRVVYVDGKGGALPDVISGKWTSGAACDRDLNIYLQRQWSLVEAKRKPLSHTSNAKRQQSAVQ